MCWNPGKILLEANGYFKKKAAAMVVLKEPGGGLGAPGSSHGEGGSLGVSMGKRRSWVEARAAHTATTLFQGASPRLCQAWHMPGWTKGLLTCKVCAGPYRQPLGTPVTQPAADGKTKAQMCQCREPRSAPGCRLQSHHPRHGTARPP